MIYDQFIKKLQYKHRILEVINLLDHDDPKVETLYGSLVPYKTPSFAPEERLVFIVDESLRQLFSDEPPDTLVKLQRYLKDLQIPHEHLLVLSNIDNIGDYLAYVKSKYYFQELSPIPYINV